MTGNSLGNMSTGAAFAKAKDGGHHLDRGRARKRSRREAELFVPGDYAIDEKSKQAHLTEEGHEYVEQLLAEARACSPKARVSTTPRTSGSCTT